MRRASSSVIAGALILAGMACSANAATVTFIENDVWSGADPNAPIYGTSPANAFTPLYAQSVTGSVDGNRRSPYEDNNNGFSDTAYSILNQGGGPAGSSATYNLSGATVFKLLWGSPDDYNHITFYDTSNTLISITGAGTDINGSELSCYGGGSGACGRLHWVEVIFTSDTPLGKVILSDEATAAFEYGITVPPGQTETTPLPAAVWLLGSVLAGGAGFGRWRKRKAKNAAA